MGSLSRIMDTTIHDSIRHLWTCNTIILHLLSDWGVKHWALGALLGLVRL